ncbi:MAG TPA: M20/M25/M40 family metallo-hydrolase [Thermoanaerobaculaceae bacterium]|nr:M20/M25/M40 family metallo-hydrolase [Thermoanaerobaculaceae bacterium]
MHSGAATHLASRGLRLAAIVLVAVAEPLTGQTGKPTSGPDQETLFARLKEAAHADARAYERLQFLCDRIGPRIAGSGPFQHAVRWAEATFREDGHESVRAEPVQVGLWIRGRERAVMTAPVEHDLPMLGLGESVGTPGVEAPVVVLRSLEEIGPQVKGKIVLFEPEIPASASAGRLYGIFAHLRTHGPSLAAAAGAVAALVRSVPPLSLATPHTGTLEYDPDKPRIPAAALDAEHADWIARLVRAGVEVRVRLEMGARDGGLVDTANVVAEIRGESKANEVVLVGAHLDSWDVGQGAQDDGVGVVHVIEAMRLIRALGVRPARTIRAVLFANEEHGLEGGKAYAAAHAGERHVAAVETDLGSGKPERWSASGTPLQLGWFVTAAQPVGLPVEAGGGGADISPLKDQGVLVSTLYGDVERYFEVHHTEADTLDKVDPALLREGLAAIAGLTWQLANAPAP